MRPQLSVIMTSYNARSTIEQALRSLTRQRGDVNFEVILIDSSTDSTADFVEDRFADVTLMRFDQRKYCGDARNIGLETASASVIAFMDADCIAAPDWAERIVAAHSRSQALVIGGAVANANPQNTSGWAYYFTEFASWSPGATCGDVDDVPGCSMSLKREAFDQYGPFLEGSYCSDSAFNWTLAEDGHRPLFDPSIKVAHLNPRGLGTIMRHATSHGRQFGCIRVRRQQPTPGKLMLWRIGTPILPLLLFTRTARDVFLSGRHRLRFLLSSPAVFLTQTAWSWGEWAGYWQRSKRTTKKRASSSRPASSAGTGQ